MNIQSTLEGIGTDRSNTRQAVDRRKKPNTKFQAVSTPALLVPPGEKSPDHGVHWEQPNTEFGLETQWATTQFKLDGRTTRIEPHEFRFVVGGDLAAYLDTHGDEQIVVPESYSKLRDDFSPYVGMVTQLSNATNTKKTAGYGISASAIEKAIRILNGPGRYDSNNYRIVGCGKMPWIITGNNGTLLCSPAPVRPPKNEDTSIKVPIHTDQVEDPERTIQIQDESLTVQEGVVKTIQAIENTGWGKITEYLGTEKIHSTTGHLFGIEYQERPPAEKAYQKDGHPEQIFLSARMLRRISQLQSKSTVTDLLNVRPNHDVGDVTDGGLCMGYEINQLRPEETLEEWTTLTQVYLHLEKNWRNNTDQYALLERDIHTDETIDSQEP